MVRDDYDYIVFRILTYPYGCFQRKYCFNKVVFEKEISQTSRGIPEEYTIGILQGMKEEGLIENLNFVRAWGNEYILASDIDDARITPAGIRYLKENSKMEKVKTTLKDAPGVVSELVRIVL